MLAQKHHLVNTKRHTKRQDQKTGVAQAFLPVLIFRRQRTQASLASGAAGLNRTVTSVAADERSFTRSSFLGTTTDIENKRLDWKPQGRMPVLQKHLFDSELAVTDLSCDPITLSAQRWSRRRRLHSAEPGGTFPRGGSISEAPRLPSAKLPCRARARCARGWQWP